MILKKSYIVPGFIVFAALSSHFLPNFIKPKKEVSDVPEEAKLWKK